MSKVFSAHAVSVDGYITGRDPAPGRGLGDGTMLFDWYWRGGRVAICNWGRIEDREVHAIVAPLREVEPPPPQGASPYDPPPIGEPGVLDDLARRAGLAPERAEVEVPYESPDRATLERALLAFAPILRIDPEVVEQVVRRTVEADAEPFRRSDGSYRFENRFRYLIAVVP
jgi:hypothetical protein